MKDCHLKDFFGGYIHTFYFEATIVPLTNPKFREGFSAAPRIPWFRVV